VFIRDQHLVQYFVIVLEALSKEFREGLPRRHLYADDLVMMVETKALLVEIIQK